MKIMMVETSNREYRDFATRASQHPVSVFNLSNHCNPGFYCESVQDSFTSYSVYSYGKESAYDNNDYSSREYCPSVDSKEIHGPDCGFYAASMDVKQNVYNYENKNCEDNKNKTNFFARERNLSQCLQNLSSQNSNDMLDNPVTLEGNDTYRVGIMNACSLDKFNQPVNSDVVSSEPRGETRLTRGYPSSVIPPTVHIRGSATERERTRMHMLNHAFEELRKVVPRSSLSEQHRLSKIATLRLAIHYISAMTNVLRNAGVDIKPVLGLAILGGTQRGRSGRKKWARQRKDPYDNKCNDL